MAENNYTLSLQPIVFYQPNVTKICDQKTNSSIIDNDTVQTSLCELFPENNFYSQFNCFTN